MRLYFFVEVSLHNRAYQVFEVTAADEHAARRALPGGDWARALIGEKNTESEKESRKSFLIRDLSEYEIFCQKFGLTGDQTDKMIMSATAIPAGTDQETAKAWIRGERKTLPR